MARVARCVKCGRFFETRKPNQIYCVESCRPPSHYTKANTTVRGYGAEHQRIRKQLLPTAYGHRCPICAQVMLQGQDLDLDHSTPIAFGGTRADRITHAHCNRVRGNQTKRALRRQPPRSTTPQPPAQHHP